MIEESLDPIRWAKKCAATTVRYRFMQAATVLTGALLITAVCLFLHSGPRAGRIALGLLIFLAAIEFPLLYLRAMRHLLLKLGATEGGLALTSEQADAGD